MTRKLFCLILSGCIVFILGCSKKDVEVVDAEFAKNIYVSTGQPIVMEGITTEVGIGKSGIWCSFKEHDIVKITLDFNFNSLATTEKTGSDEYRSEIYKILSKNAHFYNGNKELENVWGYWPEEASATNASGMELFYVIPHGIDMTILKFEYDTSILNGTPGKFTYANFNSMKPLAKDE